MNEKANTYNRIIDYLEGVLSDIEKIKLEKWIRKSEENLKLYNAIKSFYEQGTTLNNTPEKAWQKLNNQISLRKNQFKLRSTLLWGAAALILLLITMVWLLPGTDNKVFMFTTDANTYRVDTLAKGTVVYLYPSSELTINKQTREPLSVKGEAFFVVAPHKAKRLKINAGNIDIAIKGTSFRVKTINAGYDVSVQVEEGTVELLENRTQNKSLLVEAGEEGFYSGTSNQLWKKTKSSNIYLIYQPHIQ